MEAAQNALEGLFGSWGQTTPSPAQAAPVVVVDELGSQEQEEEEERASFRPGSQDPSQLAALHAKFRADLESAPLDELKEAARVASRANVADEAAGGWRITASVRPRA